MILQGHTRNLACPDNRDWKVSRPIAHFSCESANV